MPRDANGTYTLPAGNPVEPGTIIESTWANTTLDDVAAALTNSLDRNGQGGMLGPLRLEDGGQTSPGIGFVSDSDTGWYRSASGEISITSDGDTAMRVSASGVTMVADGAGINTEYLNIQDLAAPVTDYGYIGVTGTTFAVFASTNRGGAADGRMALGGTDVQFFSPDTPNLGTIGPTKWLPKAPMVMSVDGGASAYLALEAETGVAHLDLKSGANSPGEQRIRLTGNEDSKVTFQLLNDSGDTLLRNAKVETGALTVNDDDGTPTALLVKSSLDSFINLESLSQASGNRLGRMGYRSGRFQFYRMTDDGSAPWNRAEGEFGDLLSERDDKSPVITVRTNSNNSNHRPSIDFRHTAHGNVDNRWGRIEYRNNQYEFRAISDAGVFAGAYGLPKFGGAYIWPSASQSSPFVSVRNLGGIDGRRTLIWNVNPAGGATFNVAIPGDGTADLDKGVLRCNLVDGGWYTYKPNGEAATSYGPGTFNAQAGLWGEGDRIAQGWSCKRSAILQSLSQTIAFGTWTNLAMFTEAAADAKGMAFPDANSFSFGRQGQWAFTLTLTVKKSTGVAGSYIECTIGEASSSTDVQSEVYRSAAKGAAGDYEQWTFNGVFDIALARVNQTMRFKFKSPPGSYTISECAATVNWRLVVDKRANPT